MTLRQLLAMAVLPVTVAVLVPVWIAERYEVAARMGTSLGALVLQAAGLAVLAAGALLFVSSLRRFAAEGRGTLAPWDPPSRLVVRGPYRYVRNPMISGVLLVLAGEAMLLVSRPHAIWAAIFLGVNLVYIPLVEEPALRRRFGEGYREYCRHVPRVVPRARPWWPGSAPGDGA
jgi:protein-S-isoprenylcysteine O-methyltransferase Ste14